MPADAAPPSTDPRARWRVGLLGRGARSLAAGLVYGTAVAVLNEQSLSKTLVYSSAIALSCWLCIDIGRYTLARALVRWRANAADLEVGWPGWPGMVAVVLVGSVVGYTVGDRLGDWFYGYAPAYPLLTGNARQRLAQLLVTLLPALAFTYFFYSRATLANQLTAAQAAQRQAAESRLKLLESQLEPHMLFNTLANLRALIAVDPQRAQLMLDQLIAYLRSTLAGSLAEWHPLSAEFARLGDYLALMQVRMGDRLQATLDLPATLAAVQVPPLLLQPLVENSIRHGLEPAVAGGRIEVTAQRDGAQLVLSVRDTGVGFAPGTPGAGFGLSQVRERLATLYGPRATLTVERAAAEGGTIATLRLPREGR